MSKPPTTRRRELTQARQRHGQDIVQVFEDAGVSGAKGRDARTAFNAMCKAVEQRELDIVAAWSVDRRPPPQPTTWTIYRASPTKPSGLVKSRQSTRAGAIEKAAKEF